MPRQMWTELRAWTDTDGAAHANSTSEAVLPQGAVTIPAQNMQYGRALRVTAFGRYSTTATPTIRFRLRWGGLSGTLLWDSGTITLATVTAAIWMVGPIWITTRANGATGSVFAVGRTELGSAAAPSVGSATGASGAGLFGSAGDDTPAAVTVDLTADTSLALTAQWSAASASNTLLVHSYYCEELN